MKYEIIGEPMPVVVCDLEANEAMIKMARKYGIEKYGPNM